MYLSATDMLKSTVIFPLYISDIVVSSYVTILFEENSECAASKYTKFSLTEGCWRKCVIAF